MRQLKSQLVLINTTLIGIYLDFLLISWIDLSFKILWLQLLTSAYATSGSSRNILWNELLISSFEKKKKKSID